MFTDQEGWDIRCEWGPQGLAALAPSSDVVILVDVMSFSTCVSVGASRGADVYPWRCRDGSAADFARSIGAELAGPRRAGGYSLSPTSLASLPARGQIGASFAQRRDLESGGGAGSAHGRLSAQCQGRGSGSHADRNDGSLSFRPGNAGGKTVRFDLPSRTWSAQAPSSSTCRGVARPNPDWLWRLSGVSRSNWRNPWPPARPGLNSPRWVSPTISPGLPTLMRTRLPRGFRREPTGPRAWEPDPVSGSPPRACARPPSRPRKACPRPRGWACSSGSPAAPPWRSGSGAGT